MTEHRMRRLLRHLFLLALLCFAPLALWGEGKVYTPELVPKVFATDSTRLFSDPEGYVSPEGRERIDSALYELRLRNGVEFATVILPSIGERDIESFSTDLFRLWGIGSKTRNDGLLLLIVMDQRKVRFETGYGLEGILPDVLASRIQRQEILPRMRQGDYEGAIYNGVIAVGQVIQGEGYTSDRRTAQGKEEFPTRILLILYALTVLAAGYSAFSSLREEELRTRNAPQEARARLPQVEARCKTYPILLDILCLPVGLLCHLYARRIRDAVRLRATLCPQCRQQTMTLLSASEGWKYLAPAEQKEMEVGSRTYSVYRCTHCHYTERIGRDLSNQWMRCERCGARTVTLENRELFQGGRYERLHFRCLHCGNSSHSDHRRQSEQDNLTKLLLLDALLSGAGRRGGGGGFSDGGGFGGGSFGGGSSGGGGATGGW